MKVVFLTPASDLRRFWLYRLGGRFYGHPNAVTGPLILGGILKRAGHDVEVYEELYADVNYKKRMKNVDVVCIYTMTSTAKRAYEFADLIHANSNARVLIGGIHASALPGEALLHADQVIVGEGESVILDVVEGRILRRIVYAEPPKDLDAVPLPDYSILKTPCDCANVMTTRGCTHCCTFCTTSRMFAPYRQRSVDSVIAEIRRYKEMGFRYMNFEDDNFTADKERAKEICRRMIAEGLVFRETFFFGRTDMAEDEELLELLSKAHLNRVLIGIESLNQDALDEIQKGQRPADIRRAAERCRHYKIRLIASLVLGMDSDTREDIRKAVDFVKEMDAYQLQPAILTPYPGTPVYEKMIKQHRMTTDDWSQFDMMNVTFRPQHMTPWELQEEFYRSVRSFYGFRSALRIGKIFGWGYAVRRLGLWFFALAGSRGAEFASKYLPGTSYYQLRALDETSTDAKNALPKTAFSEEYAREPIAELLDTKESIGELLEAKESVGEPKDTQGQKNVGESPGIL